MKLTIKAYLSKEKFFALPSEEQRKRAKKSEVYQRYLKEGKGSSKKAPTKSPAKPSVKNEPTALNMYDVSLSKSTERKSEKRANELLKKITKNLQSKDMPKDARTKFDYLNYFYKEELKNANSLSDLSTAMETMRKINEYAKKNLSSPSMWKGDKTKVKYRPSDYGNALVRYHNQMEEIIDDKLANTFFKKAPNYKSDKDRYEDALWGIAKDDPELLEQAENRGNWVLKKFNSMSNEEKQELMEFMKLYTKLFSALQ